MLSLKSRLSRLPLLFLISVVPSLLLAQYTIITAFGQVRSDCYR